MALLQWKPDYELGVPSVDAEHREMIERINELYERLEDPPNPDAVTAALGEIHAGIAAHFALEERLMRGARWREYPDHKADHEILLDAIRDLMDDYADDPESGRERLRRALADWFGVHFASFDARLHGAFGAAPGD